MFIRVICVVTGIVTNSLTKNLDAIKGTFRWFIKMDSYIWNVTRNMVSTAVFNLDTDWWGSLLFHKEK
jgi:hypothetical protein